jgi:hypothetical protein
MPNPEKARSITGINKLFMGVLQKKIQDLMYIGPLVGN